MLSVSDGRYRRYVGVVELDTCELLLLQCHFFQSRSVSISVSMKKSVVGSGFSVYTCSPSAAVWLL